MPDGWDTSTYYVANGDLPLRRVVNKALAADPQTLGHGYKFNVVGATYVTTDSTTKADTETPNDSTATPYYIVSVPEFKRPPGGKLIYVVKGR